MIACATVWKPPYASWPSRQRSREIINFGLKTQAGWLADLVNFETDKIIIALMLGPSVAGTYEIASRVIGAVRSIAVMSTSAMIPTATARIVREGREAVIALYRQYSARALSVAFPLFGLACVTAPYLLTAWLDETPDDSVMVLILLAIAWFVNMLTAVPFALLQSDGRPGLPGAVTTLTAAMNIAFTIALAPIFGLWGVLAGTIAAVSIGAVVLLVRFHRIYAAPLRDLVAAAGPPTALVVGLAVPFAIWHALPGSDAPDGRMDALVGLIVSTALYGGAYWLWASRLGILPAKLILRRPVRAGASG
jgi:O-antigen/teichoic acid export membrane protein